MENLIGREDSNILKKKSAKIGGFSNNHKVLACLWFIIYSYNKKK